MITGKRITVTGGSGFLARALVPALLKQQPASVRCVARNEGALIKMREEFGVDILCGDVADPWIAAKAMQDVDMCFHLGAFKHVRLAEDQAHECVKTNVLGTMALLQARQPEMFVFISTDKAAQVRGVYGASKFIGERLVQEAAQMHPETKYRIVRYGNILYSTGSVVPLWRKAIEEKRPLQIANPDMTRFYWTVDQAVALIFECMEKAAGPVPYIPTMKSAKLGDLLEAVMQKYGRTEVITTGASLGDNLHETMDGFVFSNQVERYTVAELVDMV